MGTNNAKIIDPEILLAAGIDPKTGLPLKVLEPSQLKNGIKKQLRILDEQDAINRYTWYNLPEGLDGRQIERVLYYRGQGAFFYLCGKFYFLPYALNGTIDVYGRYESITPLPFNGTSNDAGKTPWINGLVLNPVYDVLLPEDLKGHSVEELREMIAGSCVILRDYTEQISQINISRQILQDPVLDVMSECFPYMRTALIKATGVSGMRVSNENEAPEVTRAANALHKAALEGRPYIPLTGTIDFQELTGAQYAKSEEFLLAMQAIDNYRLSLYGLENGGIFQKKSHMLEAEQRTNMGNVGLVMRDGLQNRQLACDIFNSIFGHDTWCEPSEVVLNVDTTGDGIAGDAEKQQKEAQKNEGVEYV